MEKRYAISDIHGCAYQFLKLLDHVDPDPEELVILGDLCNRGLQTMEVFEECSQLLDEGTEIVMGNHDQYFFQFMHSKLPAHLFTNENVGGYTSIKSMQLYSQKHGTSVARDLVNSVITQMVPYVEDDEYIFVHAAIDPRVPYMSNQKAEVLREGLPAWRDPKLVHPFDQTIVFGHTPTPVIHKNITEEDARVWSSRGAKKMAIDTGAGFGLRLTMVDLWDGIAYAYDFSSNKIIEYRYKRGSYR